MKSLSPRFSPPSFYDILPDVNRKRRFRVFAFVNLASAAGRRHLTGIYRFLGEGRAWDLNLVRSFADYAPRVLRAAVREKYDGYIFISPKDRDTNRLYAHLGAPAVFIDQPSDDALARIPRSVFVNDDNAAFGKAAARRLASSPLLRAFAFSEAATARAWSAERGAAFADELAAHGLKAETLERAETRPTKELARRLLALPKPCGVFAAYDDVGRRIVETARDAGLKIPEDIEVLSVGDDEMVCDYVRPSLTSLAPDFETEGYRAARELQAMMYGARPKRRVFLVGLRSIEERGSTRNASVGQSIARAARAYIDAHARRGITAADVVRHLGVSRSLADLRFREETGTSLLQAILAVRLGEVKRLLAETDLPIEEVARRAGYPNANYLKNLFKRHVGQSMRDWRVQSLRTFFTSSTAIFGRR